MSESRRFWVLVLYLGAAQAAVNIPVWFATRCPSTWRRRRTLGSAETYPVEPWRADFSKWTALAELLLDGDSDDRD
jgi:hypothetical protein